MKSIVALHKGIGWKAVQLNNITKMQKQWSYDNQEYKVEVFFGKLRNANQTPVIIMNTYCQGAGTSRVIDDNCDVWENLFTSTTVNEGNEYFKYLKKHGFSKTKF